MKKMLTGLFLSVSVLNLSCETPSSPARLCLDESMERLGVSLTMLSDPELMRDILRNDMHLDQLPSGSRVFGPVLSTPLPLGPVLQEIRQAIITKQPAVAEFVCAALAENLITPLHNSGDLQAVTRIIHHIWLLDLLTREMARNTEFMLEVTAEILRIRSETYGIPVDIIGGLRMLKILNGGEMFAPLKSVTMDWVFREYARMRSAGTIGARGEQDRKDGLSLNILEASVTENIGGFNDNAMAGVALAVNPPASIKLVGPEKFIAYEVSDPWTTLYESWNLAFVTGNVSHLNLFYPKLLIPTVIGTTGDRYLFNRALALWVSINFYNFALMEQKPPLDVARTRELAELWGRINVTYAEELTREEMDGADLQQFSGMLDTTLEQIMEKLKGKLFSVLSDEEAEELARLFEP